jgi:lysophospholipase L1-like esterase
MLIQTGQKLVMIGDSITDCERARPVGEGLFGAIGKGYVGMVDAQLMNAFPERAIRVVNMGSSGNTVRDLAGRWQSDVLDLRPDWLSVMIGINDVWRQFDLPRQGEIHVGLEEYERTLEALVKRTVGQVKGLVLMTPFYIEPSRESAMRRRMDQYGAAVAAIAKRNGTRFADVQAAFDRLLRHLPVESIAWDRVHPNHIGHQAICGAFLAAVDG